LVVGSDSFIEVFRPGNSPAVTRAASAWARSGSLPEHAQRRAEKLPASGYIRQLSVAGPPIAGVLTDRPDLPVIADAAAVAHGEGAPSGANYTAGGYRQRPPAGYASRPRVTRRPTPNRMSGSCPSPGPMVSLAVPTPTLTCAATQCAVAGRGGGPVRAGRLERDRDPGTSQ
jgi:hypothetical protein